MADFSQVRKEYDEQAKTYNSFALVPLGQLEMQLIPSALGDCTGLEILDLGGGAGAHARQAIDAGATRVDVVDLSPEMLRVGEDMEKSLGRDKIRWYEADVSKPLEHLRSQTYDVVMANWVFDHASSLKDLEGMWQNIATHLKPGGRFVGVRSGDPYAPTVLRGKYGATYKDHEKIPGGFKFRYKVALDSPMEFEAASMEVSYSGSKEMHEKYGFQDVEYEPYENAEVVRRDPEFWKEFISHPSLVVVKAKKI